MTKEAAQNLLEATRVHVEFMISMRDGHSDKDGGIELSILHVASLCWEEGVLEQDTVWFWAKRLLVKGEGEGMTMKSLRSLVDDVENELFVQCKHDN